MKSIYTLCFLVLLSGCEHEIGTTPAYSHVVATDGTQQYNACIRASSTPTNFSVKYQCEFEQVSTENWHLVFEDSGTNNWQDKWFLDGALATLSNDDSGMSFAAGTEWGNDSSHAVLWTQQSFSGDIKIEYEYTRLDEQPRGVTILYILATGKGSVPFVEDISKWSSLRKTPAMRTYFTNMNTYHISYAAHSTKVNSGEPDYIRARRYMPELKQGLKGTNLAPEYSDTGLFKTGQKYHLTFIKRGNDLYFNVRSKNDEATYYFDASSLPSLSSGRVGFRHMYTRSAKYRNIRISQFPHEATRSSALE